MVGVVGSNPIAPTSEMPIEGIEDVGLPNYVHRQLIGPDEFALAEKSAARPHFFFVGACRT
jgi:hypothetical protein